MKINNLDNLMYDILNIENKKYLNLHLNENQNVVYEIDNVNLDTLNILKENSAYAIMLLYLNEKAKLNLDIIENSLKNEEDVKEYFKECEDILNNRVEIVEEQGYLFDNIGKLNLMEGYNGIILGNKKKLIEASRFMKQRVEKLNDCLKNLDDENIPNEIHQILNNYDAKKFLDTMSKNDLNRAEEILYSEVDRDLYKQIPKALEEDDELKNKELLLGDEDLEEDDRLYTPEEVKQFYISRGLTEEKASKLVKDIFQLDEEEGTQTTDIAPKVDQNLNKHKDLIVQKVKGLDEGVVAIGFLRNSDGIYTRGNYVLIKENNVYRAVHKDKLKM